ncbi:MAG: amino acid permease [Nitrospirae bacterium]|nr:amino acid permease [Candidatus Troglogloeales bacterium]MBI3597886.1 amino acid permease [Candidatus Troglogloeales bacterium]
MQNQPVAVDNPLPPSPNPPSSSTVKPTELRRDVSIWGSFTWGYADVGADVYVALGLVIGAAQGAAPLAFLVAGIVYILVGLAHTELAAAYPVSGGGQYYTLRGLGDFIGLITGAALLLDYTICISLFAVASAGYINFFFPVIQTYSTSIGPFKDVNLIWAAESLSLIGLLALLNIRGIRESSLFNELIGATDMILETIVVLFGFLFAWKPAMVVTQYNTAFPTTEKFFYAVSVAIISYVGLESISQAAQETRRPASIIPRTSIALIIVVLLFALSFPVLALGILPWDTIAKREGDPVAALAHEIPYIGFLAGHVAAILGATIVLISANTGVMGASRLTYSMGEFQLVSPWFNAVHKKYHTPVRSIIFFCGIAAIQAIFAFLSGKGAMDMLVNMYAFGATLAYLLVFVAFIALRNKDPHAPRPYKVPLNIRAFGMELPVLAIIGLIATGGMLGIVLWTHPLGRIAGPGWVIFWMIAYCLYRKKNKLPLLGNIKRDWEKDHIAILTSAEEFEYLEQYKMALEKKAVTRG